MSPSTSWPEPAVTAIPGGQQHGWPLSWRELLERWQADAGFARQFGQRLLGCGFDAAFWECPPITAAGLDAPFECVLLDAPALAARPANPQDFAEHFPLARSGIVSFDNIGGDARLVVPAPVMAGDRFGHLLAFLRQAGGAQQAALWQQTATALLADLGDAPRWLSSAGLGVPWLHLRIDQRPKYYRHRPYAK